MEMDLIRSEESLFYIKKNNNWVPVGCLTANPISEETETIKTTTRDNNGWASDFPTLQSYTIELAGMVVKDDADSGNNIISYRELRGYKRNRTLIEWRRVTLSGWYVDSGKAHIISIADSDEVENFISFSASLKGFGKPEESTEKVYLLGGNSSNEILGDDLKTVIKTE